LLLLVHVLLLEDLDSALLLGLSVSAETHFTESTLSEHMSNLVDVAESALALLNEER
jgi:hypothetical protein